jgi:hypothetical protein
MKTVADIAKQTGNSKRTVQKWCRILNVRKHGRGPYVIYKDDERRLTMSMHDKGGRPARTDKNL